jgi:hypothetical protein
MFGSVHRQVRVPQEIRRLLLLGQTVEGYTGAGGGKDVAIVVSPLDS